MVSRMNVVGNTNFFRFQVSWNLLEGARPAIPGKKVKGQHYSKLIPLEPDEV